MTIAVGVDDTDSRSGMCTTYLASELIREFEEYDLIGLPRLVRLNPNIPWKTRGNGALCIRFGKGTGARVETCKIGPRAFVSHEKGERGDLSAKEFEDRVANVVESNYLLDDKNTNPAFVVLEEDPPPSLYWKAVRGIVKLDEVKDMVADHGVYRLYRNGRGLIGAASAVSWKPKDMTYEVIAYRSRNRWGTPREIVKDSVISMDRQFASTFNNYDYEEDHVSIAPNSPCPVLFGIRGDALDDLMPAMSTIEGEEAERWTLFLTNQGTDEHLVRREVKNIGEYESVITAGEVVNGPRIIPGGHLVFRITDGDEIDCTAYEPSKGFRNVVNELHPGDRITVYGSIRVDPRTINVEKLRIHSLAEVREKKGNPRCPECGKRMKSIGASAGYRCRTCHTQSEEGSEETAVVERALSTGFYEPPVSARRHLSKPLKRMKNELGSN
jgi:tRNA(Ile2)-agmatinylcytidine synthase